MATAPGSSCTARTSARSLAELERIRDAEGLEFVHPFDDPAVIAGHGSIGLEMLEDLPDLDVVVVGVGGGGTDLRRGGRAQGAPAVGPRLRRRAGALECDVARARARTRSCAIQPDSVADGLGAPFAGVWTLAMCRRYLDGIVLLDDPTILAGMRFAIERLKQVLEPAGAAALAAVLAGRVPIRDGERVAVVLSGGNVEVGRLGTLLDGGRDAARGRRMTDASAPEPPSPVDEPTAPDPEPPPRRRAAPDPEPAGPGPVRRVDPPAARRELRPPDADVRRHAPRVVLHRARRARDRRPVRGRQLRRSRSSASTGPIARCGQLLRSGFGVWYGLLGLLAGCGLAVAAVESRAMAAAILGGHLVRQPGHRARGAGPLADGLLAGRSSASIILGDPRRHRPDGARCGAGERPRHRRPTSRSCRRSSWPRVVGAPLAYLLTGIVLGDVDPFEATRRSFRVFRARKLAAALVAVFETVAVLLVVLGLGAGLDIALRVFDALGLGLGLRAGRARPHHDRRRRRRLRARTLIYTAFAISVAPQVVMFVGLTRATFGLDHVRPGGDRDPSLIAARPAPVPLADAPDADRGHRRR